MVAGNSPAAIRHSLQALWQGLDKGLEDALEDTWEAINVHVDCPDLDEGAKAFAEKRKPNWAPYTGD